MNREESTHVVPFLKWPGGKRWFAERFIGLIPPKFGKYIEPFLGSAAMFFALRPKCSILADLNADLIGSYDAVKEDPDTIQELLCQYQTMHSKEQYYKNRAKKPLDPIERAALFIYLNRTCWNGLYRVNRQNEFNVPIGTKTQVILPTDDFQGLSVALQGATLVRQDFEKTIDAADEGDFVFVDPPYTVKHNLNGFVKYNDRIFSWPDQIRLRDAVKRASSRGAMILVTNANHQSIREIYDGMGIQTILTRKSLLAANAAHRVLTEELVIRTWAPEVQP